MHIQYLLSFLFFLPCFSLYVLMPLYVYPEAGAWAPVFKTITAFPNVQFQIIVNPDNGPGTTQYPDTSYIKAVAKLNKFPNVKLLGYVYTGWASRSLDDTTKDIDLYAGWASYTKANISISGIFFDEATDSNAAAPKQFMQTISDRTYAQFTSLKTTVVFNPGCLVDQSYFAMADTIVQFENPMSKYKPMKTLDTFQKGFKKQTAVIVHSAADAGPVKMNNMVRFAKNANIGGIYFTADCCYNDSNGDMLAQTATAIAAQ